MENSFSRLISNPPGAWPRFPIVVVKRANGRAYTQVIRVSRQPTREAAWRHDALYAFPKADGPRALFSRSCTTNHPWHLGGPSVTLAYRGCMRDDLLWNTTRLDPGHSCDIKRAADVIDWDGEDRTQYPCCGFLPPKPLGVAILPRVRGMPDNVDCIKE